MNFPSLRTILWAIFWIFLVWWIANNPDQAAHLIHNFVSFVTKFMNSLSRLLAKA